MGVRRSAATSVPSPYPIFASRRSPLPQAEGADDGRRYTVCKIRSSVMSGAMIRCQSASRGNTSSPARTS